MQEFGAKLVCLVWAAFFLFAARAYSQDRIGETLSGPDSHETGQGPHGHLFGDWGGERSKLFERGVRLDFQYISDSLWNLKSQQPKRFASWNRFRWTVDIDFGALTGQQGLYFHATALWQGGGNLGKYLGLLTSPSGMSSANTCRLDSWWIEKRWFNERLTARVGQFAGQDFYGAQHYAASFIFEPMGYALGNLFTDFESFDPPSTPALEIRAVPIRNWYVKAMVEAEDRDPFAHNATGFVPQFGGVPSASTKSDLLRVRKLLPSEPSTMSKPVMAIPASISLELPTIRESSLRQLGKRAPEIICCTGWPVRPFGALILTVARAWTRPSHTTGAQQTSIAITRC
jgi:hypothetical protein